MKALVLLTLLALLFSAGQAQTVADESLLNPSQRAALSEATTLNTELISLYSQRKFGDAVKLAGRIQSLIEQNDLLENQPALALLGNVGEVFLAKGKESDGVALFQKILASYQKILGPGSWPEAQIYQRMARSYYSKNQYAKAEEYSLNYVSLFEKLLGTESPKLADAYVFLGDTYRLEQKWELAETAYLKGVEINDRALPADARASRTDLDSYGCLLYHWGSEKNKLNEMIAKMVRFRLAHAEKETAGKPVKVVESGVVNGKATYLAKPYTPPELRDLRGFVVVEVMIDEAGRVIKAKGTCGMSNFIGVSEQAALQSKFSQTSLAGAPVKVTGVIIYSFTGLGR